MVVKSGLMGVVLGLATATGAVAQTYPTKPVELVLTSAPGSSVEVLGRAFAQGLAASLGQPVVPVNRPGGGNSLGTAVVASSPPDGYRLGFTASGAFASQPYLQDLTYSKEDFEYVCQVLELEVTFVVKNDSPYKTLQDVVAAAKAQPGKIAVGTSGTASIPHIVLALIESRSGAKFNHIPYRGDLPGLQAMLGGEIAMMGVALGTMAGQPVRALATFGPKRVPTHPDIPAGTELGLPIVKTGMVGFFAPKGLPQPIRARLDKACVDASADKGFLDLAQKLSQPVEYVSGTEWKRRVDVDAADNKEVIERLGLKGQQ